MESTRETPVESKRTEAPVELPGIVPAVELPRADAAVELPRTDAAVELPRTDAAVELPRTDAAMDLPRADAAVELPRTVAAVELSAAQTAVELWRTDASVELPQTDTTVELPQIGAAVELPPTDGLVELSRTDAAVESQRQDAASDLRASCDQPDVALKFHRDQYGFFIEEDSRSSANSQVSARYLSKERIRLDNNRLFKWADMLKNDMYIFRTKPKLVKRRIRKGIPDAVRGFVWKQLCGSSIAQSQAEKGYYHRLVMTATSSYEAQIERDINRTFPRHILFREQAGIGQSSLFNVLKAYACYDAELGYCQGMGFVAGMFLMHMGEEDSFWMLTRVMSADYKMRGLYSTGMPSVFMRVYQLKELLRLKFPKLATHLEKEGVDLQSLCMQWFITNFSYNLPFCVLLRIWDIFLHEKSPKIIFRVALHFFDALQGVFLKSDFESIMTSMKEFYPTLDPDIVVEKSLRINITNMQLQELEKSYAESIS